MFRYHLSLHLFAENEVLLKAQGAEKKQFVQRKIIAESCERQHEDCKALRSFNVQWEINITCQFKIKQMAAFNFKTSIVIDR